MLECSTTPTSSTRRPIAAAGSRRTRRSCRRVSSRIPTADVAALPVLTRPTAPSSRPGTRRTAEYRAVRLRPPSSSRSRWPGRPSGRRRRSSRPISHLRRARRAANRLARAPARPRAWAAGTLVGLCLERSAEMAGGAARRPEGRGGLRAARPGVPADRLAFMVEDSGLSVLSHPGARCETGSRRRRARVLAGSTRSRSWPSRRHRARRPTSRGAARGPRLRHLHLRLHRASPRACMVPHRARRQLPAQRGAQEPGLGAADRVLAVDHALASTSPVWSSSCR